MFCLYLLLCNGIAYTLGIQPKTDAKRMVEPLSRGKTSIDELTQFSNPDSFDYDFSNDLKKEADREDIYDQWLPKLPSFDLRLRGQLAGTTMIPITTRRWPLWSTPTAFFSEPSLESWTEPLSPASSQSPSSTIEFTKSESRDYDLESPIVDIVTKRPKPKSKGRQSTTDPAPTTKKRFNKAQNPTTEKPDDDVTTRRRKTKPKTTEATTTTTVGTTEKKKFTRKPKTTTTATTTTPTRAPEEKITKIFSTTKTTVLTTTVFPTTKKLLFSKTIIPKIRTSTTVTRKPAPVFRHGSSMFEPDTRPTTPTSQTFHLTPEPTTTQPLTTEAAEHTQTTRRRLKFIVTTSPPTSPNPTTETSLSTKLRKLFFKTTTTSEPNDEVTLTTTNLFDANEIEETTTIRSRATRLRKKFTRISTTEIPATTTTILPTTITTTIPRSTTPTMRPTFRKFTRFTDTTTAFTPTTRSLLRFTQQSLFATIRPSKSRVAPKPLLLDHPEFRHAGPTYNCPVLNPLEQGEPSSRNDDSCDLLLPGFSKDGSCRCTYNVRDRDDKGCPTGFYFTCKRWNRT